MLDFQDDQGKKHKYLPPRDKWELQYYLWNFFGIKVSAQKVCPDHQAPLDAIADAYFATNSVIVWKASRGFGGKTTMASGLALLELMSGMDVAILGGSSLQSLRVHEATREGWEHETHIGGQVIKGPFKWALAKDPNRIETRTIWGNSLRALAASTKSARGPHPQRLRMDEVDEMDIEILDAALGQTMSLGGHKSQTLLSSTHQYPQGTMTEILRRAEDKGWPVYTWCYKENSAPHGWLNPDDVERKRGEIQPAMWEVEYDMSAPKLDGVIFDPETINRFVDMRKTKDDKQGVYYEFEAPRSYGKYVTSADWAKEHDQTIIITLRVDEKPYKVVAYERLQKLPWPMLVGRFEGRLNRFKGRGIHDSTGVGSVVEDIIVKPKGVDRVDGHSLHSRSEKTVLYSNYILGVQKGEIITPNITSLVLEHKYLTPEQIFGQKHTPDTVSAMALAYFVASGKFDGGGSRTGALMRSRRF
ncbi:hypothetical protein UFOVP967_41 [uncultured Caudovirales phage]|uniref:Terminase large subunit gp17-like C-terminal domain-containing protein n=1 Tax=uncultured Caudovirales phage TaxID=2100421 RepID=A0A6J5SWQ2_9CAUD|nr:hypothetical protein UFOVP521_75 [uncultured Caudovirales phage]CAB4167681.1 hypothetical protein UFOVP856_47 [uncultured Caudovirales phage]CAB4174324.1 hypothetical protein UFOVP967_41 [uncultured Caudovirales phage]CAB4180505.1 hypothetical protein UFOVP1036_40 [uncultured Caudovirales phage]CAB4186200.1 hypothetical protein UFOVP1132_27 [uncultured Caudovirales phage]